MRALGIVRVSSAEQADSLPNQRLWITQECTRQGWQLSEVIEDIHPGQDPLKRPGIKRMLALASEAAFDVLIARDTDRLHRDGDAFRAIERLHLTPRGIRVYTSTGFRGMLTVQDAAQTLTLDMLATLQSINQGEKIRKGMAACRDKGQHACRPPIGMRRRDDGWLEADPETLPLYLEMVERRERGESYPAIALALREQWPAPRRGTLAAATVRKIITSPVHAGLLHHQGMVLNVATQIEAVIDYTRWLRIQPTAQTKPGRRAMAGRHMLTDDRLRCSAWEVTGEHRLAGQQMPMRGNMYGRGGVYYYRLAHRIRTGSVTGRAVHELAEAIPNLRCEVIDRAVTEAVMDHMLSIARPRSVRLPSPDVAVHDLAPLRGLRTQLARAQRCFDNAIEMGYKEEAAKYYAERARIAQQIEQHSAEQTPRKQRPVVQAADVLRKAEGCRTAGILPPEIAAAISEVLITPLAADGGTVRLHLSIAMNYSMSRNLNSRQAEYQFTSRIAIELVVKPPRYCASMKLCASARVANGP